MQNFSYHKQAPGPNDLVAKAHAQEVSNNYTRYLTTALRVPYILEDKEFEYISKCFAPRPILYAEKPRAHVHPVPFTLNWYAYDQCKHVARTFFNNRAIDIGGTPIRTPKEHHICAKIDDARTYQRYYEADIVGGKTTYSGKYISACKDGIENCTFKAEYGYAVNVYDIPIRDWPRIFDQHKFRMVDLWMFLPLALIDRRYTADREYYKIAFEGGDVTFDLLDGSAMYRHDYQNWCAYNRTTVVRANNYDIVFEHKGRYAQFVHIRLVKVPRTCINSANRISRTIPIAPYSDTYVVPDLLLWTAESFALARRGDMYERSFLVDCTFIDKVMAWTNRSPATSYSFQNMCAQMDTHKGAVFYNLNGMYSMVYKGINLGHEEYFRLEFALYVIGAVKRYHATQGIKGIFEHMKNNEPGFWSDFKNTLRAAMHKYIAKPIKNITHGDFEKFVDSLTDQYNDIYSVNLKKPVPPCYRDVLTVDYDMSEYYFTKPRYIAGPDITDAPDKLTPPTKHTGTTKDGVPSKTISGHWTVIYDPPSAHNGVGGMCGYHAIRYAIKKDPIIPTHKIIDKQPVPLSSSWYDADDMRTISAANGHNLFIHYVNKNYVLQTDCFEHNAGYPWIKLLLQNAHWQVIDCDCPTCPIYVGDYANLQIDPSKVRTYVNCANVYCGDGAGQAAAFAKLFPGYRKHVRLPVVGNFQNIQFNGQNLAICVAHDNTGKYDQNASEQAYKNIINGINSIGTYTMMPLIGTSIYRNNLCCFKRHLANLTVAKTLCFYSHEQYEQFLATKPCRHGGFNVLTENCHITTFRTAEPDPCYDQIIPGRVHGAQLEKAADFFKYCQEMNARNTVVEISAAPGTFCSYARKHNLPYHGFHYTGEGHLELYNDIGAAERMPEWNTPVQLPALLNKAKLKFPLVVLYDNLFLGDFELLDTVLAYLQSTGRTDYALITKVAAYREPDGPDYLAILNDHFNMSCNLQYWFNDGSKPHSSEIYVTLLSMRDEVDTELFDVDLALAERSKEMLRRQVDSACLCDHGFLELVNGRLDWETEQGFIDRFTSNLMADPLVVSKFDDKIKQKITEAKITSGNIPLILGVAGASKSARVKKGTCAKCTLVISPFNALCKEYNSCTPDLSVTFYKALAIERTFKYVILDEALYINPHLIALYKGLWPKATFIGLGDKYQINARDFEADLPPKFDVTVTGKYITTTNRNPACITNLFKSYIPGIATTQKRDGNLMYKPEDDLLKLEPKQDLVVLVHTQESLARLKKLCKPNIKIMTVNQAMGGTFDSVHVLTSDIELIRSDRNRYVYTAASRSSRELIFYGTGTQIEQYVAILDTPLSRALNSVDVIPTADNRYEEDMVPGPAEKQIFHTNATVDFKSVEDILDRFFIPVNNISGNNVDYALNILAEHKNGGKFKTHESLLSMSSTTIMGGRINQQYDGRFYQREYHGKQRGMVTNTMLTRYSKNPAYIGKRGKDLLAAGVAKFIDKDKLNNIKKIEKDEEWANALEYLIALQKKLNEDAAVRTDTEISEWIMAMEYLTSKTSFNRLQNIFEAILYEKTEKKFLDLQTEFIESYHELVDFHLKRQPKEIRGEGYDGVFKAGQGISAWSKLMNLVISCVVRGADERLKKSLKDNVYLAFGKSDAAIGDIMANYSKYVNSRQYKKFGTDISQFDCTQSDATAERDIAEFEFYGCQPWFSNLYRKNRESWTISAIVAIDGLTVRVRLAGKWQRHSGEPATLHSNTYTNIGEFGASVDIDGLICAFFKGDDSFAICHDFKMAKVRGALASDVLGIHLKVDTGEFVEFIANIVCPSGFFPDIIRRVSRLSKIYTNPDDWVEIKKSIADSLAVISNLDEGCQVASRYYGSKGFYITPSEVETIVHYLKRVTYSDDIKPTINKNFQFVVVDVSKYLAHYERLTERL